MKKFVLLFLLLVGTMFSNAQLNGTYGINLAGVGMPEICPDIAALRFSVDLTQEGNLVSGKLSSEVEGFILNHDFEDGGKTKDSGAVDVRGWIDPIGTLHLSFISSNPKDILPDSSFFDPALISLRLFYSREEGFYAGDFNTSPNMIFKSIPLIPNYDVGFFNFLIETCPNVVTSPHGTATLFQK